MMVLTLSTTHAGDTTLLYTAKIAALSDAFAKVLTVFALTVY